jgi:hypothetical protein
MGLRLMMVICGGEYGARGGIWSGLKSFAWMHESWTGQEATDAYLVLPR